MALMNIIYGNKIKDQKMLTLSDMTPDEFKQARKVLGLSQSKMAHQLEVSYQTIQAWEQGKFIYQRNPISKVVEMAVLHQSDKNINCIKNQRLIACEHWP